MEELETVLSYLNHKHFNSVMKNTEQPCDTDKKIRLGVEQGHIDISASLPLLSLGKKNRSNTSNAKEKALSHQDKRASQKPAAKFTERLLSPSNLVMIVTYICCAWDCKFIDAYGTFN